MRPLIAPKYVSEFSAEEYHAYVSGMYELRTKASKAPTSGVLGLAVTRTKKGALSVRRTKARSFEYVTLGEITKLAAYAKTSQAEVWNLFKKKNYIIAQTRMEAEEIFAKIKGLPWS